MAGTKRLLWLFWAVTAVLGAAVTTEEDFSQSEIDSGDVLAHLNTLATEASEDTNGALEKRSGGCGLRDLHVRREW